MYIQRERKEYVPYLKAIIESGKLPSSVYKHTKISEKLYNALTKSELWFSSPLSFNDPFDCQINDATEWTPEIIKNYIEFANKNVGGSVDADEVAEREKQYPGSFAKFFTGNYRKVLGESGVACFITKPDNLLLWSHYSNAHKGICLKYDITKHYELFAQTMKMDYTNEYPKVDFITERAHGYIKKAIFTKSKVWEYEDEIRTIQRKPGSYSINKECLQEIIFGCKTDPNDITEIRQIIKTSQYPNVVFKQVTLQPNSFDIKINKI
ncbi:MAG TPA: DUF2971 domain-containing protein [Bacteroidia bacterium]|jgi:hypothetical protein|nr:DUF2971 domain-containing protein [Bacteroidia bacterium]